MEGAIKKALEGRIGRDAGACPDQNTLAAYLEMRLDDAETRAVESHASNCSACQETIGLALRLSEPEGGLPAEEAADASGKRLLFHFSLPISMVAMLLLAVGAGFLFYRVTRDSGSKVPQTAQLRLPPQAVGISAEKPPLANPPKEKTETMAVRPAATKLAAPAPGTSSAPRAAADVVVPQQLPAMEPAAPSAPELEIQRKLAGAAIDRNAATSGAEYQSGNVTAPAAGFGEARLAASARSEPAMKVQSVSQRGLESAPPDAVRKLAVLIYSGRDKGVEKRVSDRTFYLISGYWIDAQCIEHSSAEYEEMKPESADYGQILKLFAEIRPAVIYWSGKNFVLR